MLRQPEPDGRVPLSGKEWNHLRSLIAAIDMVLRSGDALKDRLKLVPYGWRDYRMLTVRMPALMDDLLDTIPTKKLRAIREELQHSRLTLEVVGPSERKLHGGIYIDEEAYIRLIDRCMAMECMLCERCGKDVDKCELYRIILDTLHYDSDGHNPDGSCELSGLTTIRGDETDAE